MISKNLSKRSFTSILLFLLIYIIFKSNFIFIYSLIVVSVLSIIEFLSITKKFIKNKGNFFLINSLFIIYLSFFVFIVLFFYSGYPAKLILFSILLCCAASDIGGFVFGKLFKGPKLSKISPNKTIAGSLGSIILCSIILTIIFYFLMTNFNFVILIVALLTSISCQIGDLFFSYLKRQSSLKDSGNFLPGHGGVLDRLDGIFLGIPLGFACLTLIH